VTNEHNPLIFDLIRARVKVKCLEQDLSDALHLMYALTLWTASYACPACRRNAIAMLRAKFHQMPQGFRVGQRLIELDEQFGRRLETAGAHLERWVYEPWGRWNG